MSPYVTATFIDTNADNPTIRTPIGCEPVLLRTADKFHNQLRMTAKEVSYKTFCKTFVLRILQLTLLQLCL